MFCIAQQISVPTQSNSLVIAEAKGNSVIFMREYFHNKVWLSVLRLSRHMSTSSQHSRWFLKVKHVCSMNHKWYLCFIKTISLGSKAYSQVFYRYQEIQFQSTNKNKGKKHNKQQNNWKFFHLVDTRQHRGLPGGANSKEPACWCRQAT